MNQIAHFIPWWEPLPIDAENAYDGFLSEVGMQYLAEWDIITLTKDMDSDFTTPYTYYRNVLEATYYPWMQDDIYYVA